ncbi:hypothetical protein [Pantoea sp.]|uniref:hypothetical protein n=1 Tax=Pantoea sp. TaxID=69393 RepID=UPI0028A11006|nr:hypothetical protein [Pantoea sp.]
MAVTSSCGAQCTTADVAEEVALRGKSVFLPRKECAILSALKKTGSRTGRRSCWFQIVHGALQASPCWSKMLHHFEMCWRRSQQQNRILSR